jgi:23S rRNA (cytosine1962-C5)-methyltransferase
VSATFTLSPGRLRETLKRHPWVYKESVTRVAGEYANGDVVRAVDPRGNFVAHALVNDRSRLFLRLVSFAEGDKVDAAFWRARIRGAAELREKTLALPSRANAYRVCHSEGDGIPGLIVDRIGDVLVVACTSFGVFKALDAIFDELEEIYRPTGILELGKAMGLRGKEGLPEGRGVVRGKLPEGEHQVTIDGVKQSAPLEVGQKTGLFLDQRDNVQRIASFSAGKRVLDVCCYGGSFGLAAGKAGAREVTMFDSSDRAVEVATRNIELNGLASTVKAHRADLYQELRRLRDAGERYDIVVLDPPKFASTRFDVPRARKGYTDANSLGISLLAQGGVIATCSCSHHVQEELFEEIVREAAARAGRDLQILERRGAGADHPTDVMCPEGRYLKCFIARAR